MIEKSYKNFILEKIENDLLELLTESIFLLGDEFNQIMYQMGDDDQNYSIIADMFSSMDMEDVETDVSYIDTGDDNNSVKFVNPEKVKNDGLTQADIFKKSRERNRNSINIGRLARKVIEIYKQKNGSSDKITDKQIEDFVNAYKSYYDIKKGALDKLKLLKGNDIKSTYLYDNYFSEDGSLGNSCMAAEECQSYLDFYVDNPNVEVLVLMAPNNKIMARALVWTLVNGDKFMDRVYTNRDSDENIFIKWAVENKAIYKSTQNSNQSGPFVTKEGEKGLELEVMFKPIKLSMKKLYSYPYLDTLKYFYWEEGILRNWTSDTFGHYIKLEDTDGLPQCFSCSGSSDPDYTCNRCGGFSDVWVI
jgi:hypothetical protein